MSNGVIAAVALGSLAFTPFTEQYARESVPPGYGDSPVFRRTNRVLTAIRGGVLPVTALLGAGYHFAKRTAPTGIALRMTQLNHSAPSGRRRGPRLGGVRWAEGTPAFRGRGLAR
ncbi:MULTISPECIES: hypothetical protein [unclassified Streptomyces]|uniref:hypothetical protein n=1 Tax=unclassified Streptomyces TaxID=2593676 RepID=UPI00143E627F|nr:MULTISPECIES: hypothetical protein [unclassified Streptomyces]QIY65844.1 hypothetical protein HEP85_35020 [Streptomyces sp. RPA4-2]